jgi:Fe2+ or Zn2+ uptake regulation protein
MRAEYVTRAREKIAAILNRERRFLSAAEIHHLLDQGGAKVALSTVYRNLEHLQSKGVDDHAMEFFGRCRQCR